MAAIIATPIALMLDTPKDTTFAKAIVKPRTAAGAFCTPRLPFEDTRASVDSFMTFRVISVRAQGMSSRLALHSRRRRVLDLDPVRRSAGAVWGAEPLGYDALTAELARMVEGN
jgi:hypothetical protein